MKQKIAKILAYHAPTETGLVRLECDDYAVVEGPITADGPYRWGRKDSNYEAAKLLFADAVGLALKSL